MKENHHSLIRSRTRAVVEQGDIWEIELRAEIGTKNSFSATTHRRMSWGGGPAQME